MLVGNYPEKTVLLCFVVDSAPLIILASFHKVDIQQPMQSKRQLLIIILSDSKSKCLKIKKVDKVASALKSKRTKNRKNSQKNTFAYNDRQIAIRPGKGAPKVQRRKEGKGNGVC